MRRSSDPKRTLPFWSREMASTSAIALLLLCGAGIPARPDDFGRLEGAQLFGLASRPDATKKSAISVRELEALPAVLRDERGAFVLVKTDLGNLAKLVVSSGFRELKSAGKDGPLLPVLVLERFETVDAGDRRSFKSRGKDVMLFDEFQFDLDTGCVVPAGAGGDIQFSAKGPGGPRLAVVGQSELMTLEKPIPWPAPAPGTPSSGRAVLPADFAGRYYLVANGQWSGTLDLTVDTLGAVTGHFRSDKNGASYDVNGTVAPDVPHKISFSIQFPRAKQLYEGLLWTEGKAAIAGTVSMLERPYGFVAIREGSTFAAEAAPLRSKDSPPSRGEYRIVVLEEAREGYVLDGKALSAAELARALTDAVKAKPATKVRLRAQKSVPFERIREAIRLIQGAGISSIGFSTASETDDG
jgi:hypothetical protein